VCIAGSTRNTGFWPHSHSNYKLQTSVLQAYTYLHEALNFSAIRPTTFGRRTARPWLSWLLLAATGRGWLLVGRKPGEGLPRPQAPRALPRTPPAWWWVLGGGCGAYVCDCVWVCASNKAKGRAFHQRRRVPCGRVVTTALGRSDRGTFWPRGGWGNCQALAELAAGCKYKLPISHHCHQVRSSLREAAMTAIDKIRWP
jgi:hypothetical protein